MFLLLINRWQWSAGCSVETSHASRCVVWPARPIGSSVFRPGHRGNRSVDPSEERPVSILRDLWEFLRVRKIRWLLPLILVMVSLGGLLVLAQGSVIAPFSYTLFWSDAARWLNILGISAYHHDAAACLVTDGRIVAAAQEERFTRFPRRAIGYCLEEGRLRPGDVDYVAFYDKPFVQFERLFETYLAFAPRGFKSFAAALPVWPQDKLFRKAVIGREL